MHDLLKHVVPIDVILDAVSKVSGASDSVSDTSGTPETESENQETNMRHSLLTVSLNRKLMSCEIITQDGYTQECTYSIKLIDAWIYRDVDRLYAITDWQYKDVSGHDGPRIDAVWVKGKNIIVNVSPKGINNDEEDGVAGSELYPMLRILLLLTISGDELRLRYMGANEILSYEGKIEGLADMISQNKENLNKILIATLNYVCDLFTLSDETSISESIANEI